MDAPTYEEMHTLLQTFVTRLMKLLANRRGLPEGLGQTYLAEPDADGGEASKQRPLHGACVGTRPQVARTVVPLHPPSRLCRAGGCSATVLRTRAVGPQAQDAMA